MSTQVAVVPGEVANSADAALKFPLYLLYSQLMATIFGFCPAFVVVHLCFISWLEALYWPVISYGYWYSILLLFFKNL